MPDTGISRFRSRIVLMLGFFLTSIKFFITVRYILKLFIVIFVASDRSNVITLRVDKSYSEIVNVNVDC